MKMAVLLSGLNHVDVNDKTIGSFSKSPYFRHYIKNIKTYIYDFFTEKGYSINTFICTNESPLIADVLESYNPVRYSCIANTKEGRVSKTIEVLRLLIDYIKETQSEYDIICLTRLDIYFLEPLLNIDYTKLNIMSMTLPNKQSRTRLVDDNFYLFPKSMLNGIYDIYRTYRNQYIGGGPELTALCFKPAFEEKFSIHYIKNEERMLIHEFTSMKLELFNSIDLIVNKYLYTESTKYYSRARNAYLVIENDKDITFVKKGNGEDCSFGYTLNPGDYNISFDILSDGDIQVPFILLDPEYYTPEQIHAYVLKNVKLNLHVKKRNTYLLFNFTKYNNPLIVNIKNMSIEKIIKPLDLNVVVRGHYRTFDKTHPSLRKALSNTKHKIFMHTWDTIDANTTSWHGNNACDTNILSQKQRNLLNTFDDGCIIQSQSWTEEERNAIVLSRPYKTFLYFWQSIYECLYRIKEESQYILFTRYDVQFNADFSDVSCEEDEIVIGYAHRSPNDVFAYGFTDIVFLIHYNDVYKLLTIPQKIIDLQTNMDPRYKIAEDPITDFFYSNWAKVTPKWLASRDISIIRPELQLGLQMYNALKFHGEDAYIENGENPSKASDRPPIGIFSKKYFNSIQELDSTKKYDYCFIGQVSNSNYITEARKWIIPFVKTYFTSNSIFINTGNEPNWKSLGDFDYTNKVEGYCPNNQPNNQSKEVQYRVISENLFYFNTLRQSKFILCPGGIHAPWSFRFYETLMCGSLPIVESWHHTYRTVEESKIHYKYILADMIEGFEEAKYMDLVNENTCIFTKYHMLNSSI